MDNDDKRLYSSILQLRAAPEEREKSHEEKTLSVAKNIRQT